MFDSKPVIVGLDIGTSKICAVVAEANHETLNIIGIGQSRSRGVRKGEIVDASAASEDIRNAIVDAETMADAEIRRVYLGVTGGHVRSFNNHGFHPVPSSDRVIDEHDVQDVLKNARAVNLPAENRIVHMIPQHFSVDGQPNIPNPVGMAGARLEADVHVVHGNNNRIQSAIEAVRSLQIEVDDAVFTGLASALALLNPDQKKLGALVIDLGSGAAEFVVYADGIIKHAGVIAVGGDHVSNDLAVGLKIPLGRAEDLKIKHGSAIVEEDIKGRTISVTSDLGFPDQTINLEHLRRIMHLRLEEIFTIIAREVEEAGLLDVLREGVFISGGGARIANISTLAQRIFGLPASVGASNSLGGARESLEQPEFAAGIGLVRYGHMQMRKKARQKQGIAGGIKNFATALPGAIIQRLRR